MTRNTYSFIYNYNKYTTASARNHHTHKRHITNTNFNDNDILPDGVMTNGTSSVV